MNYGIIMIIAKRCQNNIALYENPKVHYNYSAIRLGPKVIKTHFMLNLKEYKISTTHKN